MKTPPILSCSLSGLPIQAGCDVRILPLVENKLQDLSEFPHHAYDPRGLVFRGKANNRGRADFDMGSFSVRVLLKSLQTDYVSLTTKDYLSYPTDKLLKAIWKRKIYLRGHTEWQSEQALEGVPSFLRIAEVVEAFSPNLKLEMEHYNNNFVGVRGDRLTLGIVEEALQSEFSVALTTIRRNPFPPEPVLFVFPKVQSLRVVGVPAAYPRKMSMGMVRSEVWDYCLREGAAMAGIPSEEVFTCWDSSREFLTLNPNAYPLPLKECVFSVDPLRRNHSKVWQASFNVDGTPEEAQDFCQDLWELYCVETFMGALNLIWRPSHSTTTENPGVLFNRYLEFLSGLKI